MSRRAKASQDRAVQELDAEEQDYLAGEVGAWSDITLPRGPDP